MGIPKYSSSPHPQSVGDIFQDLPWMSETADSSKRYTAKYLQAPGFKSQRQLASIVDRCQSITELERAVGRRAARNGQRNKAGFPCSTSVAVCVSPLKHVQILPKCVLIYLSSCPFQQGILDEVGQFETMDRIAKTLIVGLNIFIQKKVTRKSLRVYTFTLMNFLLPETKTPPFGVYFNF